MTTSKIGQSAQTGQSLTDRVWEGVVTKKTAFDKKPKYVQQKFGITYHFAWVLGFGWGEKENHNNSDFQLRDYGRKAFVKGNHYTFYGPDYVVVKFNHQRFVYYASKTKV